MISTILYHIINFSQSNFFFNFITFYFFFNNIALLFFIFITGFNIYYIYSSKKTTIFFSNFIINFNKIANFCFMVFDLVLITFFKKVYFQVSKPQVIINFSFYNFFENTFWFSIDNPASFINSYFFEFSISNTQVFFIFLCRFIFFYVTYTFKYTDTSNFIYKTSFFSFNGNSQYFILIFMFFINILNFFLFIFFTTENILIFFIAFEFSVIPIFFMIGFFGKRSQKFKAMNYIFFFTIVSAIPMLIGIIFFYQKTNSFNFFILKSYIVKNFSNFDYVFSFIVFYIPFSAKVPMMPFHVWLPEAHVEASTEGSMLLAGIMLKLGLYGLLKINYFILFKAIFYLFPYIATQAIISSFVASFVIYKQIDIKKIIAYSSIIHMNIGILAFFSFSSKALIGAMLLAFSHGLTSTGLFLCVGIMQNYLKERNVLQITGLLHISPFWAYFFGVLCIANAGFPSTFSFIAEFFIISGIFEFYPILGLISYIPIAICAHRNFFLFTQVALGNNYAYSNNYFFNKFSFKEILVIKNWDIFSSEILILAQIIILTFYWGINPNFFFDSMLVDIFYDKNFYYISDEKEY